MEAAAALICLPLAGYFYFAAGHEVGVGPVLALIGIYIGATLLAALIHVTVMGAAATLVGIAFQQKPFNVLTGSVRAQIQPTVRWGLLVMAAAGPVADLVAIPIFLVLPLPPGIGPVLAAGALHGALTDLVPVWHRRTGAMNAGARLFIPMVRRSELFDLAAFIADPKFRERSEYIDDFLDWYRAGLPRYTSNRHLLAQMLRQNGRHEDLLALHADGTDRLPLAPNDVRTEFVVEWTVLTWPDVPPDAVERSARRLVRYSAQNPGEAFFTSALALARLRQGHDVEAASLCRQVLMRNLTSDFQAAVLSIAAIALHRLGQDGHAALDTATAITIEGDTLWMASLRDEAARVLGERRSEPNTDNDADRAAAVDPLLSGLRRLFRRER
ncbi:hypothetical protein ABTW96_27785 [Nocardia beijingensis]|uniref:hypothetical protein n=1 Tax=Nocardia beijingensis TaxID=95162 RepID=UPI00332D70DC